MSFHMKTSLLVLCALALSANALPSFFDASSVHTLNKKSHSTAYVSGAPWISQKRRGLLQGTDCDWNYLHNFCEGSLEAGFPILIQSNSTLALFVATQLQCELQRDQVSCNDVGFCLWRDNIDDCAYVDFAVSNPESPCVQAAPITMDWLVAAEVCPIETTQEGCLAAENCAWNPEASRCFADVLGLFIQVSEDEFVLAAGTLIGEQLLSAEETFTDEFNTTDPGFDWNIALDYDIPAISCPENTNPAVCDYANAFARSVIGAFLYCSGLYSSPGHMGDCNSDPLCHVNQENDDVCTYSDAVDYAAGVEAVKALADYVPGLADRNHYAIRANCNGATDEGSCSSANELCLWNPLDLTCDLPVAGVFQIVAGVVDDPSDGVCATFSLYGETGCESIVDEESCLANDQCQYFNNVCFTSGQVLIGALVADDPGLAEGFDAIDAACVGYLSPEECEAA